VVVVKKYTLDSANTFTLMKHELTAHNGTWTPPSWLL